MMLYESGARIGELLNVELKDLEFDSNGVLVEINGKTGKRRIRLVESAKLLRQWVNEIKEKHPRTPYLWFGDDELMPSKYAATTKFLRKTAKLAGLRKKVNPHLFRHSRASELAQKLREPQLRAFMGWTGASDMPQVYIHLSAQDMDKAILDLYKTDETKTNEPLDEIKDFYMFWKKMKALC
jgi:integrase